MSISELTGQVFDQEETELLKIVESYCISEKTKPTVVRRKFFFSDRNLRVQFTNGPNFRQLRFATFDRR